MFPFAARKINIGKFQHKKTNVMVVTDVAVSTKFSFPGLLSFKGTVGFHASVDLLPTNTPKSTVMCKLFFYETVNTQTVHKMKRIVIYL